MPELRLLAPGEPFLSYRLQKLEEGACTEGEITCIIQDLLDIGAIGSLPKPYMVLARHLLSINHVHVEGRLPQ